MKKPIEEKIWEDYTHEEKSDLLQHWWYYYGKMIITLAEWEEFNKLVKDNTDKVFDVAVINYVYGVSSQPLICAMRENKVKELFESLPKIDEIQDEEFKTAYTQAKKGFIAMLIKSYNKPDPAVPMEKEIVNRQIKELAKLKKYKN